MVTESIAIIAITVCIAFVFLRAGHTDYALSLLPIYVVPLVHLLTVPLLRYVFHSFLRRLPYAVALSFADIAALAVSCLLILFFAQKVKSKRNRTLYLVLLSGYNILLTCAYVFQTLQPMIEIYWNHA